MRPVGPESSDERLLREWIEENEKHNLDRLEEGAKTITQLVIGLFGLFLAVLTLNNQPAFLKYPIARWAGGLAVIAFFIAVLAALVTLYPRRTTYQVDNLSEMRRGYKDIVLRKVLGLRVALCAFVIGAACLGGMIVIVLGGY